jgi:hypothetical protein
VVEVVERQLAAYNAHDLDGFVACYTDGIVIIDGEGNRILDGVDVLRAHYGSMFAQHPEVHAEIESRTRAGAWVVDEEKVARGGRILHILVAYRIGDGLINRVVMLR